MATQFKKIANPTTEFTYKCLQCDLKSGIEYFGCWTDPKTGEFGDDRWVIECTECLYTEESPA